MHRLAPALAGVLTGLVVAVAPASAHGPAASFTYEPSAPAAGEAVTFHATAVPVHEGEPIRLAWDLDDDRAFDDANGATASRSFGAGEHVVRLIATTGPGHQTIVEKTVAVAGAEPTPTPTPPPADTNQAPVAAFDHDCRKTGPFVMCAGLFAREHRPHTIDASPSHDPDGSIARYQWDLDGNGSFERDTGSAATVTHTFEAYTGVIDPRKRVVRVRVTDDDGATAEAGLTLTLLDPACEAGTTFGRIQATSLCLRHRVTKVDGKDVDRWYSERPVTLNGLELVPAAGKLIVIDLPRGSNSAPPHVSSLGASVYAAAPGGDVRLATGRLSWRLAASGDLQGFELASSAKLNGLRITGMPSPPKLEAGGTSRLGFFVALPAQFGGSTSDEPITLRPGTAVAAAAGALDFEVGNASIGPIGLKRLHVSFDGDDLWEIEASIGLPEPVALGIDGDAGIRDGEFEHAGAELDFPMPGVGPFGPVMLQSIRFRVEVEPEQSECVPKVGVEYVDQRKILHDITGHWYDVPNFEIDHGVPTFAVCGGVRLTAGPQVAGVSAISLDAGLGFASYADRPSVFRAFGNVSLVEIPVADATFEVHENGYTRMNAKLDYSIPDLASIRGMVLFEMLAPKFNAIAYVDACLDFVDWCAGARGIVSSKGLAVCLKIDVIFDDWTPGFGYRWGDTFPTLYFSGCDIGEYKEQISSPLVDHVETVPAQARAAAAAAPSPSSRKTIVLPAGLPGAAIVAKGDGAPPKITLVGPNGERVSTPDGLQPVQRKPFLLLKDPRANLTQIAVGKPAGGAWKVIVQPGSAPVVSLKSAQGLERPRIRARVTGTGQRRVLAYRVARVEGQSVEFLERGPSAGGRIGRGRGERGRLRFHPAGGVAERREIVALVKQDGRVRDEFVVARYAAPRAPQPARPKRLRIRRRGQALRVTWRAARPAEAHDVRVTLSDGRRLRLRTRRSQLAVPRVGRHVRGSVTVRGVLAGGRPGKPAIARLPR